MQTLNIVNYGNFTELNQDQLLQIEGGNFWYDLAYVAGVAVHGLVVFATEGGNSAGICVR
jgi:hypothetical protein